MCAKWEGEGGAVTECVCVYVFLDTETGCICETPSEPCRAEIHAYVGCPDGNWNCFWGVAGDRERVWPLFDVLADVKSGAFGLVRAP